MSKELLDKLYTILSFNSIVFNNHNTIYEFHLKNNEIHVIEETEFSINLKSTNNLKIQRKEYLFDEFLALNIDITEVIEENYKKYLKCIADINIEYELITYYLLLSDLKKEDKDLLEYIINNTYKYYTLNINENYGLTFVNPFNGKLRLTLVNLKNGKCFTDIPDIINLILKDFHKNRVKFLNILEYNMEELKKDKEGDYTEGHNDNKGYCK